MSYSSTLKPQVDLPVWEWLRMAPVATSALTVLKATNDMLGRYMYFAVTAGLYRYDTYGDVWHQLASPVTNTTVMAVSHNAYIGHPGKVISCPGSSSLEIAGLFGSALVGYKIRIISGTGAGQERTISAVAAPVIKDRGVVTTASSTTIIDASVGLQFKNWKPNQYKNYQVRMLFGTGSTQVRPILSNTAQNLVIADAAWLAVTPWAYPQNVATGIGTIYQIESNVITVDTPWTVNPDATSSFMVMSGGLWVLSAQVPYGYMLQYYDVLSDVWYFKTNHSGCMTAAATGDLSMEVFSELGGALLAGTATAGTIRSLADSGLSMEVNRYANMELRITSGPGIGQALTILGNTATTFNLVRDWTVAPTSASGYALYRDCGKLLIVGNTDSSIKHYSVESDMMTVSRQHDFGVARSISVTADGDAPIGVSGIVVTPTGILTVSINNGGNGYQVGSILSITAPGSGAQALVTSVDANGAVMAVTIIACGTGYSTGTGNGTTTVSPVGPTSCVLSILTSGPVATATTGVAHNVQIGMSVVMAGSTLAGYNGAQTVIGSASSTTFQYSVPGNPASPAVANIAQQPTVLQDCTKNWTVNEHIGKHITFLAGTGTGVTGYIRRIVSNTATALTYTATSIGVTPVNGSSKYVIHDPRAFGTEVSWGSRAGGGRIGFVTSSVLSAPFSTLTDTTKTWPVNAWSGPGFKIASMASGGTGLTTITTAAAHGFVAGQWVAITGTANYNGVFYISSPIGTTFNINKAYVANEAIGVCRQAGRKVRITSGSGVGLEIPIVTNTANALTVSMPLIEISLFAAGANTTVTTAVSHGLVTGQTVTISGTSGYNGALIPVTVLSATTFSIPTTYSTGEIIGYAQVVPAFDATSDYVIMDNYGVAASGTATTLVDFNQNWPVGGLVNKRLRITAGLGHGNEVLITANTSNTLTFVTGVITPDATTCYSIYELPVKGNGLSVDMIRGCSSAAINNRWRTPKFFLTSPKLRR